MHQAQAGLHHLTGVHDDASYVLPEAGVRTEHHDQLILL